MLCVIFALFNAGLLLLHMNTETTYVYLNPVVTVTEQAAETAGIYAAENIEKLVFPVNINTADSELLQLLPGVGPAIAERIIAYREEYGNFSRTEEIMNVSGIGEKTFEKMKDMIAAE